MSSYPYLEHPGKLPSLFKAIREAKTPDKFTFRFLADLGFSSSKERELLPVLKQLGFLGRQGRPLHEYRALKNPQEAHDTLKRGLRLAYGELLTKDEKAYLKDERTLAGYFGELTGENYDKCINYAKTFLVLAQLAEMQKQIKENNKKSEETTINISFNINLPETVDQEVYEAIFKSLGELINH
jgi:hypothetical protein